MTATALNWRARTVASPLITALFALAGVTLLLAETPGWPWRIWFAGLLLTGAPVVWRTLGSAAHGHFATDIVATLAIVASLLLQQPLAGLIVVLMQTGGEALERYAEGRASRAVKQLEDDAPRIAHRLDAGRILDVEATTVRVGDVILVRPGELVPCDGVVTIGSSHLDTSRLTGEPIPARVNPGSVIMSGSANVDGALHVQATAEAAHSQYARIVELVRTAAGSKSPLQRLADRYAVWFTPFTLVTCAVAWAISGDPTRALAVLVVATPCPLILATPIAIIGGINRAASRQIIMRTGGALERLSAVRVAVFDKTGTLTIGRPLVSRVIAVPPYTETEVLRLTGALEQHSGHALAHSVVDAAQLAGGELPHPTDVVEHAGQGVSGRVGDHVVAIGGRAYISERVSELPPESGGSGTALHAHTAIDGRFAGTIEFADQVRAGAAELVTALRALGLHKILLLSGDNAAIANDVAERVGIDVAEGDLLPGEKMARVAGLSHEGRVMMVGDGSNDAPAVARADVGVALAGHGGGVTAEAADVLILNDELSRLPEAITISRRTMRLARQSIWVGLSLSGIAMVFAATGHLAPVAGALLQEGIDVAVILNALRAAASPHGNSGQVRGMVTRVGMSSFPGLRAG
jgi:heavy metal translocating P-type ATPase